jgi:hypothetical protein
MVLIYTVSETCVWGSPLEVCRKVFWVAAKAEEESEDRFRLPWRQPLGAALQHKEDGQTTHEMEDGVFEDENGCLEKLWSI